MASIKRNFIYNIILNLSAVLFPLITAPYVARVLDPDGLGLANFASTYASYYAIFAALGVSLYGVREVSKRRDNIADCEKFISEVLSINAINTLIAAAVFLISICAIHKFQQNFIIFFIAGFSICAVPLNISWYFSGMEKFGFITSRNLIIRIASIVCLFLFVKERSDLYIYMLLSVLSSIGGIMWNFSELHKAGIRPRLTFNGIKKHYKPLLILFSSSIAISIYTMLDTLMLGFISNYSEVGFYNSATHISKALLAIVTSLSAVAVPRVAYYIKNKDYENINSLISKSLGVVSFLAIPMTIGLSCIAPTFVPLFFGDKFEGAVYPLMVMSGIITAIGFNNLTGVQILIGMGLDKRFLQCVLVGTVSNFTLNLILIPYLGAVGAAMASVIAESLILLATIIFVKKFTAVQFGNGVHDVWKSLVAALTFIPITMFLSHFLSEWYLVVATIISCTLVYILMQHFMKTSSLSLVINAIHSFKL